MKVVVLGSGGREAAIAWKIAQHHGADSVVVLPGNGGTPQSATPIDPGDVDALAAYCRKHNVDMVIPGGETLLAADLVGRLAAAGGPPVVGPDGSAARLEGSKIWARQFMQRHGVATAGATIAANVTVARYAAEQMKQDRVVIKFDGLAAGKGVWVCNSPSDAQAALDCLELAHGSDVPVILEEMLDGDELSLIAFTDGKCVRLLQPAQDHKQAFSGDIGPNTGGMGAYCPVAWCDAKLLQTIDEQIIAPTLRGLQAEKLNYRGPLYFGLMITTAGPKLLEYNVRFGDPETQVLLPMLENDLLEIYQACYDGTLDRVELRFKSGSCVGVVLAGEGYPERSSPKTTFAEPLAGGELPESVEIFHAGTQRLAGQLLGTGGRMFTVTARGETLDQARTQAYKIIDKLMVPGTRCRCDIGCRERRITDDSDWQTTQVGENA